MAVVFTKEQVDFLMKEFNDLIATNQSQNESMTELATATEGHTKTVQDATAFLDKTKTDLEAARTIFMADQAQSLANAEAASATAIAAAEDMLNKAKLKAQAASDKHDMEVQFLISVLQGSPGVDPTPAAPTPPAEIVSPPAPEPIVIQEVPVAPSEGVTS